MKKRIEIISILLVVVISTISVILLTNKIRNREVNAINNDMGIAIMLQNENGTYDELSDNEWPTTGYQFDVLKIKCKNNSSVRWDESTNSAIMQASEAESCRIYFDKEIQVFIFEFKGQEQVFTAPKTGVYKIELWGASGGDVDIYQGGRGGYTEGIISLQANDKLYIYVGGQGSNTVAGGYNGGGDLSDIYQPKYGGSSGGGATDVRLTGGEWNNFEGLKSRTMVAAGGGGANNRNRVDTVQYWYGAGNGGYGGGLTGGKGESINHTNPETELAYGWSDSYGGSQTKGGLYHWNKGNNDKSSNDLYVKFGYSISGQSTGGGGYYAGASGSHSGAGGGSSYISGHVGCVAIKEDSIEDNVQPKAGCTEETKNIECSKHYSNKIFTETIMKAGNELMPTHDGNNLMLGNTGNGYAKITLIRE